MAIRRTALAAVCLLSMAFLVSFLFRLCGAHPPNAVSGLVGATVDQPAPRPTPCPHPRPRPPPRLTCSSRITSWPPGRVSGEACRGAAWCERHALLLSGGDLPLGSCTLPLAADQLAPAPYPPARAAECPVKKPTEWDPAVFDPSREWGRRPARLAHALVQEQRAPPHLALGPSPHWPWVPRVPSRRRTPQAATSPLPPRPHAYLAPPSPQWTR